MKIYISGDLKSRMASVARFVGGRTTIPAVQSLLLKADRDGMRLTATDLVVGIDARIPAQVSSVGEVLIPPNIVNLVAGASKVTLQKREKYDLDIRTDAYAGKLKGLPTEEYPPGPSLETEILSVPITVFKEMLAVAGFAGGAVDSLKFGWRQLDEQKVRVTALGTNGIIAGVYSCDIPGRIEADGQVTFPAASVRIFEAHTALSDSQTITLGTSKGKLMASDGASTTWACLSEVPFPDIAQAFQQFNQPTGTGILKLQELDFGASKMLALLSGDKATAGLMQFGEDELLMSSQETELGNGRFSIPFVESTLKEDLTLAINFELVRRVASIFLSVSEQKNAGSAQAAVIAANKPLILKMTTAGKGRLAALIMTMQINTPPTSAAETEDQEESGDPDELETDEA